MGVDPGLTRCGVGVVEGGLGSPLKLIAVGVIRTPADLDHAHRLLRIHDGLEE
ncbi:crossover junction endodeoxyribonuclease RuvC, partial [Pseudomonas aeruginosa]